MTIDNFNRYVREFIKKLQEMDDKDPTYIYSIDPNDAKKYLRIVTESRLGQSKSVYCFIGMLESDPDTYGKILKPASYAAPERKNPRGSIFETNPIRYCGKYGLLYINDIKAQNKIRSRHTQKLNKLREKIEASKSDTVVLSKELLDAAEDQLQRYGYLNKTTMESMNALWKIYKDAV
jgi:hypothetical protein